MKKLLVIIGAGGLGREVVDIVQSSPNGARYDLAFIDDSMPGGTIVQGVKVLGPRSLLQECRRDKSEICIAIGNPSVRKTLVQEIGLLGLSFATIVDPTAVVRSTVVLGTGVIIGARTFLSCNTSVGAHAVLNPGAIMGHDVIVGSYTVIGGGANISGGARIGEAALIGAGASILRNTSVGDSCVVGMGATVFADIESGMTVFGNPARPLPFPRKTTE
jgi:sugar O-acyltransferase (sialic acid O-acetyltransferase NeuD family)